MSGIGMHTEKSRQVSDERLDVVLIEQRNEEAYVHHVECSNEFRWESCKCVMFVQSYISGQPFLRRVLVSGYVESMKATARGQHVRKLSQPDSTYSQRWSIAYRSTGW